MSTTVHLTPQEFNALAELIRRAPLSRAEQLFVDGTLGRIGEEITAQLDAARAATANAKKAPGDVPGAEDTGGS